MHLFQADLGVKIQVVAVATQGRQDRSEWVSQYTLSYSVDGRQWFPYDAFTRVPIVSSVVSMLDLMLKKPCSRTKNSCLDVHMNKLYFFDFPEI